MMYGWAMKLICKYGFYKFFPDFVGELKLWEAKTGIKLFARDDYFTFAELSVFPNYSFKGQLIFGIIPAISNFAGKPEEVMAKNKLTYNVKLGTITPRAVASIQKLNYSNGAYVTFPTIPQAFALDNLTEITGFEAFVDVKMMTFKLERFDYEDF